MKMRITRYKHECDTCGNETIINQGSRLFYFNYMNESLCSSCFGKLPEDKRKEIEECYSLIHDIYGKGFEAAFSGKSSETTYELTEDQIKLLRKFKAFDSSRRRIKIKIGASAF